jgi:hypothetical protein
LVTGYGNDGGGIEEIGIKVSIGRIRREVRN